MIITAAVADLTIITASVTPFSILAGNITTVNYTLKNNGNVTAASSLIRQYGLTIIIMEYLMVHPLTFG